MQSVIKIVSMFAYSFHDQIVHRRLHFNDTKMQNKTLNRAIHDPHHRQNENIDQLKHDFYEYISAEMSRLNEYFKQHDDSDQSFQPHSRDLRAPTENASMNSRHM